MLLDYGANPHFEHKLTRATIIEKVFNDYDYLMQDSTTDNPTDNPNLNKLVMIAAIMQHAGLRFDTSNSRNKSPLDTFGLWVGSQRKEQVLAEFLEKINHADINSIRSTDVIARSPETLIQLSAEDEQKIALFRAGRYTEIFHDDISVSIMAARNIFNNRQHNQAQPSGPRTTIADRIRNYTPRPIDYLGQPITDHSSHIEETRAGSILNTRLNRITSDLYSMPIISHIREDDIIATHFSLHVASAPSLFFMQSTPHTESFPTDVSLGDNVRKITELNIPDEEIPNEYKCILSLSIMSDPVYLQGDETGQRFERSWIAKWLREHSSHPSTRKIFDLTSIQSDIELKTSIDDFMQRFESTASLFRI